MNKYIAGAVLSFGLLASPLFTSASGLTNSQIQSILALLSSFGADSSTIANVQTALDGGTPATAAQAFCYNFNTDLTVGNSGTAVSALNQALTSSNIDTSGNSATFDENTAGDVVTFQSKYGIRQTGYVGPLTRAKLNALYGCRSGQVSPPISQTIKSPQCELAVKTSAGIVKSGLTGTGYYDGSGSTYVTTHPGESLTFTWKSTNADYSVSPGNDRDLASGTMTLSSPEVNKQYVWTFYGMGGTASCGVMIEVIPNKPTISDTYNPVINTIDPSQGVAGTIVTVRGSNFSPRGNPTVQFLQNGVVVGTLNGSNIVAVEMEGTYLQFRLDPILVANSTAGVYQLRVVSNGYVSNAKDFTIVGSPAPYVTSTFTQSQLYGSEIVSTYTYQIQNFRDGLVLDVEPINNCNDAMLAPLKRDCSQYRYNLSGKAAESYSNVKGDPYVAGGASYRFTGANGQLNLNGFVNPTYVPPSGYTGATPDTIDFRFILRDSKSGTQLWTETKRVFFKG